MPGYIKSLLTRFQYKPKKKQYSPHAWQRPIYSKLPSPINEPDLPIVSSKQIQYVQQVLGSLLYYAIAVDSTLLVAISELASIQTKATSLTLNKVSWLLDHVATNPNVTVTFIASDMQLRAHSEASYFSVPKSKSRAGGHVFLSNSTLYAVAS